MKTHPLYPFQSSSLFLLMVGLLLAARTPAAPDATAPAASNLFNAGRNTARESAHLPRWARLQQVSAFGANHTLGAKASS